MKNNFNNTGTTRCITKRQKIKDSTLKEENIHSGRHESEEFTRKDHI